MKITVDDKIPYIKGILEQFAEVQYLPGSKIKTNDIVDSDVLIVRTRTKCNEQLLDGTAVRAIFTATIGFDHIDTDYCSRHAIHWQNAPACNAESVVQYIASVFAELRFLRGTTLRGLTLAVVGVGNVGSRVAELAELLGMNVLRVDPFKAQIDNRHHYTDYVPALQQADIITYHTPLTYIGEFRTHHLFNEGVIKFLKRGAIVINSSRGEVVDTQSILRAIDRNIVSAAIIDVWENEPDINRDLLAKAFIATPHIAGYSADSKRNGTVMTITALCRHFHLRSLRPVQSLPAPEHPIVDLQNASTPEEAACQMFRHVYNVFRDVDALRADPSQFERLRGDYWMRREIVAYSLPPDAPFADYLKSFGVQ